MSLFVCLLDVSPSSLQGSGCSLDLSCLSARAAPVFLLLSSMCRACTCVCICVCVAGRCVESGADLSLLVVVSSLFQLFVSLYLSLKVMVI